MRNRTVTRRFQGAFLTLSAPGIAQSRRARDLFLSRNEIRSIWSAFDSRDRALVGLGSLEESAIIEGGFSNSMATRSSAR